MQKRFSIREVALLTVPVLAVGIVGWWLSKRPVGVEGEGNSGLRMQLLKPTTLEAFEGFEGSFLVTWTGREDQEFNAMTPYLDLETRPGGKLQRFWSGSKGFVANRRIFNGNSVRFPFKRPQLPPGTLYLGVDGLMSPAWALGPSTAPRVAVHGKWKLDQSQIRPLNLAAMPRLPLVVLRSVKVDAVSSMMKPGTMIPIDQTVQGEAIFELKGAAMDQDTSFDIDLNGRGVGPRKTTVYGVGGNRDSSFGTPETPLTRVYHWQLQTPPTKGLIQVSGRVSVGERWPLGFEFEPFRIQDVENGKKLKFKSFVVGLPHS